MRIKSIFISLIMIFVVGCSTAVFNSYNPKKEIIIDGSIQEWGRAVKYHGDSKMGVGILNDSENLYISLVTLDRNIINKILFRGLAVSFDQPGDFEEFGIKYPARNSNQRNSEVLKNNRGNINQTDFGERFNRFLKRQKSIWICNSDLETVNEISLSNLENMKVKARYIRGAFYYELKIPLNQVNYPYSINTNFDEPIQLNIIIPTPDINSDQSRRKSRGLSSRRRGSGRSMFSRQSSDERRTMLMEEFKISMDIILAAK